MESVPEYEVRCPSCDVSFPAEKKVCLHCGGRTVSSGLRLGDAPPPQPDDADESFSEAVWGFPQDEAERLQPASSVAEHESAKPSPMRALVTLLWVVLAIAFSILRSCGEG